MTAVRITFTSAVSQPLRKSGTTRLPRRRRKQRESLLDLLVDLFLDLLWRLPWQANILLAAVTVFALFPRIRWWSLLICLPFLAAGIALLAKRPGSPPTLKGASPSAEDLANAGAVETNASSKQLSAVDVTWDESLGKHSVSPIKKPIVWSLELLQSIEWKRFEDLCAAYARAIGYRAETTALGPDGGVDVNLYKDSDTAPSAIMQCKAWGRSVGVAQVRELLGSMVHTEVEKGIFLTTSYFTGDAIAFAEGKNIKLMSGSEFVWWLGNLPAEESRQLLNLATEGDYTTPTCPSCGLKMVSRESDSYRFWGCQRYPRCNGKIGYRSSKA